MVYFATFGGASVLASRCRLATTCQGRLVSSFLFLLKLHTDLEPHRCSAGVRGRGFTPASRRESSFRQWDAVGTRSQEDCATNRFLESLAPPECASTQTLSNASTARVTTPSSDDPEITFE